jgi:hypothetical protein
MKNMRNVAALLLVLTGLIHISLYFEMVQAPDSVPLQVPDAVLVIVFGVLYTVIGVLLFKKARYSEIAGVVFPALGLLGGLFVIDSESMDNSIRILLLLIDLVILVCCVVLLLRKEPED